MIAAARPSMLIRRRQQRIDLGSTQEGHQCAVKLLRRNGKDASDLRSVRGRFVGGVAEERMHCRQPKVARARRYSADRLQVVQERRHQRRIDVLQIQCRRRLPQSLVRELQQHPECVAVRGNRVCAGLTLMHQALCEESLEKRCKAGPGRHGDTSQRRSRRDMACVINSGHALKYQ